MAVFPVAVATGDIIKYQSFVYGSFVWEIHVRYNNQKYQPSKYDYQPRCASVDNHIPRDDIFDYHPRR